MKVSATFPQINFSWTSFVKCRRQSSQRDLTQEASLKVPPSLHAMPGGTIGIFSSVSHVGNRYGSAEHSLVYICIHPYLLTAPLSKTALHSLPTAEKSSIEVHFHCSVTQLWCHFFLSLFAYPSILSLASLGFHLTQVSLKAQHYNQCGLKWNPRDKREKRCVSSTLDTSGSDLC